MNEMGPHWYKLNDDGTTQPIDFDEMLKHPEGWTGIGTTIDEDWIGGVHIHTAFLSLDHSAFGDWGGDGGGAPLLFETMCFGPSEQNLRAWRESTIHKARKTHKKVCDMVRRERAWYRRLWRWLTI